jgi:hypothetical protein
MAEAGTTSRFGRGARAKAVEPAVRDDGLAVVDGAAGGAARASNRGLNSALAPAGSNGPAAQGETGVAALTRPSVTKAVMRASG